MQNIQFKIPYKFKKSYGGTRVLRNRRPPKMHPGCTDPLLKYDLRPLAALGEAREHAHRYRSWEVIEARSVNFKSNGKYTHLPIARRREKGTVSEDSGHGSADGGIAHRDGTARASVRTCLKRAHPSKFLAILDPPKVGSCRPRAARGALHALCFMDACSRGPIYPRARSPIKQNKKLPIGTKTTLYVWCLLLFHRGALAHRKGPSSK